MKDTPRGFTACVESGRNLERGQGDLVASMKLYVHSCVVRSTELFVKCLRLYLTIGKLSPIFEKMQTDKFGFICSLNIIQNHVIDHFDSPGAT